MSTKKFYQRKGPKRLAFVVSFLPPSLVFFGLFIMSLFEKEKTELSAYAQVLLACTTFGFLVYAGFRLVYWIIDGFLQKDDD